MTVSKSALAVALILSFAAPLSLPDAEAASQQQTTKKKAKKKPTAAAQQNQQKKTNFRAARPDEYGRIFACDDWSLSVQPFCLDGHVPQFNVGGYRRGGKGRGGMR